MTSPLPPFLAVSPPPTSPPTTLRLQALYASTSTQRTSNPTGYNSNSSWWSGVIEECLRSGWVNGEDGDRLVLDVGDGMVSRFEDCNGGRPKGFGGVVETMVKSSPPMLHPLKDFMDSPTPIRAPPSLTSRFIGKPLWWVLGQLNPFGGGEGQVEKEEVLWKRYGKGKEYVHMSLLDQAAAAFTAYMSDNPLLSYSSSLFDLSTFHVECSEVCFPTSGGRKLPKGNHRLSRRDCEVLIRWLARDLEVLVTDGEVIKILEPGEIATDHEISEADRGTLAILVAITKVEEQMKGIEKEIEQTQEKAKQHLKASQKSIALSYLRSKKQLEDILDKRVGSLESLKRVLRSIDQAKGDVEIMKAYQTSTSTLSTILQNPLLNLEHVERTTEDLAEVLADSEEVAQAVRVGGEVAVGNVGGGIDEDELEGELEELIREEKAAAAAAAAALAKAKEREKEGERDREKETAKAEEAVLPSATTSTSILPPIPKAPIEPPESTHETIYQAAQQREKDEKARAEVERLKRDERLLPAE